MPFSVVTSNDYCISQLWNDCDFVVFEQFALLMPRTQPSPTLPTTFLRKPKKMKKEKLAMLIADGKHSHPREFLGPFPPGPGIRCFMNATANCDKSSPQQKPTKIEPTETYASSYPFYVSSLFFLFFFWDRSWFFH